MKFFVIDTYIGLYHAYRLAKDGHKVFYYTDFIGADDPQLVNYATGYGFEGLEKVLNYNKIDEADVIFSTDIGHGGLIDYLRKIGKLCFGGGYLEMLEMNRIFAKDLMKELGIRYPDTKIINGINDVLDYFEKNDYEHVIKFNTFRGDMETLVVNGFDDAALYLDWLAPKFGPFLYNFPFIIEKKIEGVMLGVDLFFNGYNYIEPIGFGIEVDSDVIESWDTYAIDIFKDVLDKIKPILIKYNYRGALSIEGMWDGDNLYVTDWTTRFPTPLSLMYCEYFDNYTELIYKVAKGERVKISVPTKYTGLVNVFSEDARNKWLLISYPKDVKFRFIKGAKIDGNYYAVPSGVSIVGSVLGQGDDYNKVISRIKSDIGKVKGLNLFHRLGDFETEVKKVVDNLETSGYSF